MSGKREIRGGRNRGRERKSEGENHGVRDREISVLMDRRLEFKRKGKQFE